MKRQFGVKRKFVLVITILLLSVFVVDSVLTIRSNVKETENRLTSEAIAFSELSTRPLAEAYDLYFNSGYFKFWEIFNRIYRLDKNISKIQFIDVNGKIILDSDNVQEGSYKKSDETITDNDTLKKIKGNSSTIDYNPNKKNEITEIYYPYYTDWGSHSYTLRYFVSYDEVRQNVISIVERSIILMLIFLFFSVFLITGFINNLILSPIASLSKSTQRISKGDYDQRIELKTNDEIGQLANATNKMARTLAQNIADLKELDQLKDEFIDVAAHNLKIPLTHLKVNISYLLQKLSGKIDKTSYEIIKDIEINSSKLNLLSEDLINVTTISKESLQSNVFMPVNITKVINEIVEEYKGSISNKKIKIKIEMPQEIEILADSQKIKQVFANLIDNAIKFSYKEGLIEIRAKLQDASYLIEVQDHGVGIEKEELEKIFQKFYRAPSSANFNKDGTGLGLYLSKLIVDIHHGKIWLQSEHGKGTKFSVILPKKEVFKRKYFFHK